MLARGRAVASAHDLPGADGIAGCTDDCKADSWSSAIKNAATVLVPEDLLPAARKYGKRSLLVSLTLEGTAGSPGSSVAGSEAKVAPSPGVTGSKQEPAFRG